MFFGHAGVIAVRLGGQVFVIHCASFSQGAAFLLLALVVVAVIVATG
jgi:hypothetical protein